MQIHNDAENLINILHQSGYKAYFVGGCVRDFLMGKEPADFDITTSALPRQIETVLENAGVEYVETGLKHGTVTAIVNHIPYEITTFRRDGEYKDNRHPDKVNFVDDVSLDLARRDFTINALAYNSKEGLIDLYCGKEDINNKIVRAVGDADTRFNEDALRIMRCLRFSSVLGFDIEENTAKSIHKNKSLLSNISVERIYAELMKLLCGFNAEKVLTAYSDVICEIMPELTPMIGCKQNSKWHIYDVYVHTVKSIACAPKIDYLRFALLLHDCGKPYVKITDRHGVDHFKTHPQKSFEISCQILKRLKVSNEIYHKVSTLVLIHDDDVFAESSNIKYWLRKLGVRLAFDFFDVKIADMATHNLTLAKNEYDVLKLIKSKAVDIINSGEPYRISDLAVNGNDLKQIGYFGVDISKELERLIRRVCINKELNTKQQLIKIAVADKNIKR